MKIGILALQGAVEPHQEKITALGAEPVRIRRPSDLVDLQGVVLPGGESSTMLKVLDLQKLWDPMQDLLARVPALGVCAGSILLATEVANPSQRSFGCMNVRATRNAYGTQLESFITSLEVVGDWAQDPIEGVFIRAPRLKSLGDEAKVLLRHGDEEVLIEQGKTLAASFHPELSEGTEIHRYFLDKCRSH